MGRHHPWLISFFVVLAILGIILGVLFGANVFNTNENSRTAAPSEKQTADLQDIASHENGLQTIEDSKASFERFVDQTVSIYVEQVDEENRIQKIEDIYDPQAPGILPVALIYINMSRNPERNEFMIDQLQKLHLPPSCPVYRFEGVAVPGNWGQRMLPVPPSRVGMGGQECEGPVHRVGRRFRVSNEFGGGTELLWAGGQHVSRSVGRDGSGAVRTRVAADDTRYEECVSYLTFDHHVRLHGSRTATF